MGNTSVNEGCLESLEKTNNHRTIGKLKNVIKGCIKQYDLESITIICGYKALYSGPIDKFYSNCDIGMVVYRNELLEKEVIEKSLLNNNKLFIFLNE